MDAPFTTLAMPDMLHSICAYVPTPETPASRRCRRPIGLSALLQGLLKTGEVVFNSTTMSSLLKEKKNPTKGGDKNRPTVGVWRQPCAEHCAQPPAHNAYSQPRMSPSAGAA